MNVLATALVCIADAVYVVSMLTKKKLWLVVLLLISDIFFACQYLCYADGLTGALSISIDIAFLLVVCLLEKFHKEKYIWIASCVAIALNAVFCGISWTGPISLLPTFSMSAYLIGMIINKLYYVKAGAFIRNTLNIVYMFLLSQYVGAALEICLAISTLVGIIISVYHSKKTSTKINDKPSKTQV